MKNRLKILSVIAGILITLPILAEQNLQNGQVEITNQYGARMVVGTDSQEYKDYVENVRRQRGEASTNLNPYTDHRTNTTQTAGEGSVEYQSGVFELNDKYITHQNTKGEAIQQISGMAGQISQQAGTLTNDPKTAANASAAGSYMGSAGALMGSMHYKGLSSNYANAARQNAATATANKSNLTAVETRLTAATAALTAATTTEEKAKKAKEVADLTRIQTDLTSQIGAQEGLASSYNTDSWIHTGFSALNFLSAGALAWTADMQHQQGIQLDKQNKRCFGVKNDPKCPDFDPSTLAKPNQTPPPGAGTPPNPRAPGGVTPPPTGNPLDGTNVSNLDGNSLLQPAGSGSGAGEGSDVGFLKPSGSFAGMNGEGNPNSASKDGDVGGKGMSPDVTYGGGSADLGLIGSSSFGGAASMGLDGFDISQFLPAHLRGEDYASLEIKAVNDKDAKKAGILLGKDSPSLFTRVTKAHQKKAPEMQEVF